MYTEEKFEDEEDMRERARNLVDREGAQQHSEPVLEELLHLAGEHEMLYPTLVEIISRLSRVFRSEIDRFDETFSQLDQF